MPDNFKPVLGSGDTGFTDLFGGKRIHKTAPRVAALALLDELAALLGLIKTGTRSQKLKKEIAEIQRALIMVSGNIAGAKTAARLKNSTTAITALIALRSARLPKLKEFIIPGKTRTEALIHLARARARLCEILVWRLKAKTAAVYLNRLSDYLFLLSYKK